MKELTWRPQGGAEPQVTHRTLKAQFGDGYAQRAGDGINTRKEVWPLTFVGLKAEIKAIADFFDEHAGYKAFRWRGKTFVAAQGYTLREGAFVWTLKVTIEEEPRP